jgi:hypothetical protein
MPRKPQPLKVLPPIYPVGPKPAVHEFGDGHFGIVYDATLKEGEKPCQQRSP